MAGRAALDLDTLTRQDREQLYAALIEKRRRDAALFGQYFPDCTNACTSPKSRKPADHGGLCRKLYRQHVAFMDAGALYDERLFLAANQIGKTQTAAFETVCHLTGRYPNWWRGKRFHQHINAWAAGDTMETTRDILQIALLGDPEGVQTETWNGMLPANLIVNVTRKTGGVPLCVHQIWVRHVDGRNSSLQFKSYDQGRAKFQGAKIPWIWLDEEPPEEPPEGEITPPTIYSECVLRGINCEGQVIVTFTPLRGATPFLLGYLDGAAMLDEHMVEKPAKDVLWSQDNPAPETSKATMGNDKPVKLVVGATWDDAAHLTAEKRDKLWKGMPVYLRDARTKGIPTLGAGAIFPFGEADIKCTPFKVPPHWPRSYALDAQPTVKSHLMAAYDKANDTVYLIGDFQRPMVEALVQASAIKASGGARIKGVGDASLLVSDKERLKYIDIYRRAGLDINLAVKGVESGIQRVYDRFAAGKIKVFSSCGKFFLEFRLYRRAEGGKIVKENDHLMDCLRYLIASLEKQPHLWTVTAPARSAPAPAAGSGFHGGWMGG